MRRFLLFVGALAAAGAVLLMAWSRNPRMGTRFANEVLNPALVRRGGSGVGRSELGTLEHIGRRTGTRHLTPIHPVPTEDGFKIIVPLGTRSHWVQNVLAAGHCRLQLHDTVYDLDEPVLLAAGEMPDMPGPAGRALDRLGVEYLLLRRFAERPGALEAADEAPWIEQPESGEPVGAGA